MNRAPRWLRARLGTVRHGGPQEGTGTVPTPQQIEAINRFPNQNPNPVMRVSRSGELVYANTASTLLLASHGLAVGAELPADLLRELRRAAADDGTIEVRTGARTFALLAVDVPEFDFMNVYGTDVTAMKALDKFPNENPNPVLRMTADGRLIYANPASGLVRKALRAEVGDLLPGEFCDQIQQMLASDARGTLEVQADDHVFELLVVPVTEFDWINLYGTDVTAARQIERLGAENERLLLNILPASIAERLRSGEAVIADRFDELTVLFADCVGFTEMSSRLPPAQVVDRLNRVFSAFDSLADQYSLEKIKTIGDAYMVAGGLLPGGDHPERVAAMGLEMLAVVQRLRAADLPGLEVRIGMHVGPAVAGVIGLKKFIYDVWGDTVNVASRMQTLSEPGRMLVAESTYRRLRDAFEFEPGGTLDVRGLGPTETHYLVGPSGDGRR